MITYIKLASNMDENRQGTWLQSSPLFSVLPVSRSLPLLWLAPPPDIGDLSWFYEESKSINKVFHKCKWNVMLFEELHIHFGLDFGYLHDLLLHCRCRHLHLPLTHLHHRLFHMLGSCSGCPEWGSTVGVPKILCAKAILSCRSLESATPPKMHHNTYTALHLCNWIDGPGA